MLDQVESRKTGLRQWQHIFELETYIIDVGWGVFHMVPWGHVIYVPKL